MANNLLHNTLQNLGFTDKESSVYLSALELGRASLLEISRHSKVKRSTVYELVPSLEARGLIKRTKYGKRFQYLAENPRTISGLLKEREKRFEEVLPQFMTLFDSQDNRPKVFFYQGALEVQEMYEDTLRVGAPLMNYTSVTDLYQYMNREWVEEYIAKRIKYQIPTRIIALDSPEAREWQKTAQDSLRDIRLVPKESYDFSADVHIYGDKVIITTYKGGLFGLRIEDQNIAQMQKMAFELMWKAASGG